MLRALRSLFTTPAPNPEAMAAYIALLAASRNPFFYTVLQVPDTLDGRFEVIVLHVVLVQQRLSAHPDFSQQLSECFFADMERAIREMGVMDPGVGKRITKMAGAYQGRFSAYTQSAGNDLALKAALSRNLYGTVKEGDVALLDHASAYVRGLADQLAAAEDGVLLSGAFVWPAPESLVR
jgi:cytochrome b pre-mRNA-processing protein 3